MEGRSQHARYGGRSTGASWAARRLGLPEPPADVTFSHLHLLLPQHQRTSVLHTVSPGGCPGFPDPLPLACIRIPWLLSSISAPRPALGHALGPRVRAAGLTPSSWPALAALTEHHGLEAHEQQTPICCSPGGWKSQTTAPADSASAADPLLVHRWLSAHCVLRRGKGRTDPLRPLSKGTDSIREACASRPTPLPKAPPAGPPWAGGRI